MKKFSQEELQVIRNMIGEMLEQEQLFPTKIDFYLSECIGWECPEMTFSFIPNTNISIQGGALNHMKVTFEKDGEEYVKFKSLTAYSLNKYTYKKKKFIFF